VSAGLLDERIVDTEVCARDDELSDAGRGAGRTER
jgi:hypothetical protein